MSSMQNNLLSIVKEQYFLKLKAHSGVFIGMVITQIIGLLFSIANLTANRGSFDGLNHIDIAIDTTVPIFIFTFACAIFSSINLNLKESINMDFTFVSNRITSNVSSIIFLSTLALFGAVTCALSGVFLRAVKYLLVGSSSIIESEFFISLGELFCSMGSTFFYILLLSSLTYFFTVLVGRSRIYIIVILSLVVLLPRTTAFSHIIKFYGNENNFLVFMIKVIVTTITFFIAAILTSNNMEVRK